MTPIQILSVPESWGLTQWHIPTSGKAKPKWSRLQIVNKGQHLPCWLMASINRWAFELLTSLSKPNQFTWGSQEGRRRMVQCSGYLHGFAQGASYACFWNSLVKRWDWPPSCRLEKGLAGLATLRQEDVSPSLNPGDFDLLFLSIPAWWSCVWGQC